MDNSSSADTEIVYESEFTRVTRPRSLGHVRKEARGPGAHDRIRHEFHVLGLLAGLSGVVQVRGGSALRSEIRLSDGGRSLAQILRAQRLTLADTLLLGEQLAQVLSAVHGAGVTHCDVCPANIALGGIEPLAAPLLIDFDLAQAPALRPSRNSASFTGTLGYAAPELSGRTARAVDHRADLYSLGATLYELATGRPPFESADPLKLMHDHFAREPASPSAIDASVPAMLSRIILRLLAKDPDARYQTAEGLMHDLRRARAAFASGGHAPFELGEHDFPARFAAPAQLVGRDAEVHIIEDVLHSAASRARQELVIEGEAGVGKSALLREIRARTERAGGIFLYGKFDQFQQQGATVGGMSQALSSLARQLMPDSGRDVAARRARLDRCLQSNPAAAALLPELGGGQLTQAPPLLDVKQAEQALLDATIDVIRAVASPEQPLVLALDDLQWAGATSLRIFDRVAQETGLKGVLLVGSHRPAGTNAPLLTEALARWSKQGEPPRRIALAGLPANALAELLMHVLRLTRHDAQSLAPLLEEITSGNPMGILELLNALRSDGLLRITADGWLWNASKIRRFVGSGSLAGRLADRIAKLPQDSREVLEAMSCLGTPVNMVVLEGATVLEREKLEELLRTPAGDDLVFFDVEDGDYVQFRHDMVQQAVLTALSEERRALLQLEMARRLAAAGAIAEAGQQYLGCAGYVVDPAERQRVAQMLHGIGKSLATRGLLEQAELHFAQAEQLAYANQGLAYEEIVIDRHAALVVLARADDADSRYALLQSRIADPVRLAPAASMHARSLELRGLRGDALALCRDMLLRLGVHVPEDLRQESIGRTLDEAIEWVCDLRSRGSPAMQAATDPRAIAAGQLILQIAKGDIGGTHEFIWARLESFRLWRDTGATVPVAGTMLAFAQMLALLRQDYRAAYELGRHVVDSAQACGFPEINMARLRSNLLPLTYFFEPVEDCMEEVAHWRHWSQSRGDNAPAAYASRRVGDFLLECGSLEAAEAEYDDAVELARRSGFVSWVGSALLRRQRVRMLRGKTKAPGSLDDEDFTEAEHRASLGAGSVAYAHFWRAHGDLILGDMEALVARDIVSPPLTPWQDGQSPDIALSLLWVAPDYVLVAVRAAEQLRREPEVDRDRRLAVLENCRLWLAARAEAQRSNFLHLAHFVRAEQAWVLDYPWKAATAFDDALKEVRNRSRPLHEALITERAALFHLAYGMEDAGLRLMSQAREFYAEWGAVAKVRLLDMAYPSLQPASASGVRTGMSIRSGTPSSDMLDLMGIARASRALSSQRTMPDLVSQLTDILAELTGATRATLMLVRQGGWAVLDLTPEGELRTVAAEDASALGLVPASVLSRLGNLREPLQVPDIAHDERFAGDPYFAGRETGSLLLVPVVSQGSTVAILFLENRFTRGAFGAQRLEAVVLICGQLAVSLANTQLYEQLEQRVRERTEEIEKLQQQLLAKAHRSGMAQIATNVLHNVNNVLNSITVAAGVMQTRIFHSRSEGLARTVSLMKEQPDLARFIEEDPRGRVLPEYLERLAAALAQEREDTMRDIVVLRQSVEHIAAVVTRQQAYARSSAWLKEPTSLSRVIDEALLMYEGKLHPGTTVVREGEVGADVELDKTRMLQILVNLIANANDAMQDSVERKLTLAAHFTGAAPQGRIVITVGDTGHGITPEDMTHLFSHGFTTKVLGHGFGLHSAAIAAMEMGGTLSAESEGRARGATFKLDIPLPA
jgi:signal transduction histidine kinase